MFLIFFSVFLNEPGYGRKKERKKEREKERKGKERKGAHGNGRRFTSVGKLTLYVCFCITASVSVQYYWMICRTFHLPGGIVRPPGTLQLRRSRFIDPSISLYMLRFVWRVGSFGAFSRPGDKGIVCSDWPAIAGQSVGVFGCQVSIAFPGTIVALICWRPYFSHRVGLSNGGPGQSIFGVGSGSN